MALENSEDESEFDEELFRLAAETEEELLFVTQEIRVNLSLLDENKRKEDWTEEKITEILSRETFNREMLDFAMKLEELYRSISEEQNEASVMEKGDENE